MNNNQIASEYIVSYLKKNSIDEEMIESASKNKADLIEAGILSSLDFIGLIASIEEHFNIEIDFSKYDPSLYTTISGLVELVTAPEKFKNG